MPSTTEELEWGEERETTLQFYKFTSGAAGELSLRWDPVANSESVQRARESSSYAHRPLHNVKMEERRSNGFRVKPSFGQVLGYIQEGEPLTLDLPNPKASIYTQPRPLKRPTRVTVELRFHDSQRIHRRFCPTATTGAWTLGRPCATTG